MEVLTPQLLPDAVQSLHGPIASPTAPCPCPIFHDQLSDDVVPDKDQSNTHTTPTLMPRTKFTLAMEQEPPKAFVTPALILGLICSVGFLSATINGYNSALLDGLLQNNDFKQFFHGSNAGLWVGIISFLYKIGQVTATPFIGPCIDTWGRRKGIFVGLVIVILGAIIGGTTSSTRDMKQFMVSRFILGFGGHIVACGGPIYVVEMCHPAYRGSVTALCNTSWFIGTIIVSGVVRGSLNLTGNQTWLVPVLLQLLFPCLMSSAILLLPESPRWLYVNNECDRARALIIKYHGLGKTNSLWVILQFQEFEQFLKDRRWWDYGALFRNRASRYRFMSSLLIGIFGQWTGNAVTGLLLSAVLDTAGVHNQFSQTNINLGLRCLQLVMAVLGACIVVARLGRRPILISTNITLALVWLGMSIASSRQEASGSTSAAKAILALIFLFNIVFSIGITPLQALYVVEVLSFEMRAKGVAVSGLVLSGAELLNQFAWPVSLARIGWKTYLVLMSWCLVQASVIYLVIPETRNFTLEQLDEIFESERPCRASLEK